MAIAFDSVNAVSFSTSASPSFTLAVVDGTNTCVVIGASWRHDTGGAGSVSSATVGGINASFVVGHTHSVETPYRLEIWVVTGITAGNKTVQVNFGSARDGGVISAICFTGVHQSTPAANNNSAEGSSTAASVTVTTAIDQMVVDCAMSHGAGGRFSAAGANQTERYNVVGAFFDDGHGGSNQSGADGGVMSWTNTDNSWTTAAVSLQPAATDTPLSANAIFTIPRRIAG